MVIGSCRMWLGLDPATGGLRAVTDLCGLSFGDDGSVEENLARSDFGPEPAEPVDNRKRGLRLVSHRGSP